MSTLHNDINCFYLISITLESRLQVFCDLLPNFGQEAPVLTSVILIDVDVMYRYLLLL